MNQTFKVTKRDVAKLVTATFPEYKGRSFRVEVAESVTFSDLHWSGGSKSEYAAVRLDDGASGYIPAGISPWSSQTEGMTVPVPPNVVVVERSWFCGKDCGLRFYVNPANLPRLLPGKAA